MDFIELKCELDSLDQVELVISLLTELNYEGFVEEENNVVLAYIETNKFNGDDLIELSQKFNNFK